MGGGGYLLKYRPSNPCREIWHVESILYKYWNNRKSGLVVKSEIYKNHIFNCRINCYCAIYVRSTYSPITNIRNKQNHDKIDGPHVPTVYSSSIKLNWWCEIQFIYTTYVWRIAPISPIKRQYIANNVFLGLHFRFTWIVVRMTNDASYRNNHVLVGVLLFVFSFRKPKFNRV